MKYWSDASDSSHRFGHYLDNLDWLDFCHIRHYEFSPTMYLKCAAFYRKPHIVSKTNNAGPTGSTVLDISYTTVFQIPF